VGDHPQDSRPQRLSREAGGSPAQGRDTIAAVATARGRSGIAVLRVSGTGVRDIARRLLGGVPPPRRALLREFRDLHGKPVDRGIALFFPAPASYTGEDVLELQGHGGVAVTDALLECVLAAGARLAGPGEFTQRAFLEGRIDLTQAEAVADLIEATSAQAVRAAQATLRGEFSRRVQILVEEITRLRVRLEAGFDFSDEGIEDADPLQMGRDLSALEERLERTVASARDGVRLGHGLRTSASPASSIDSPERSAPS
jgi:tRNA modification GTPase